MITSLTILWLQYFVLLAGFWLSPDSQILWRTNGSSKYLALNKIQVIFFLVCGKTLRLRKKLNRIIESHCIWTSSRSNHSRNCCLESASLLHAVSPENSPPYREYLVNLGNSGISSFSYLEEFFFFHLTHAILSRVTFVWNKNTFVVQCCCYCC